MSGQRFYADPKTKTIHANGAISFGSGGYWNAYHCAKILNCPVAGTDMRRAVYQTADCDTWFSIPAVCKVKGKRITGYITTNDDATGPEFRPHYRHYATLGLVIPAKYA